MSFPSLTLALALAALWLGADDPPAGTQPPAPIEATGSWTRFRGSDGAGRSSTPWRALDLERDRVWKQELFGSGHSSPVVANGRVWLTEALVEDRLRRVVALDAETGEESTLR